MDHLIQVEECETQLSKLYLFLLRQKKNQISIECILDLYLSVKGIIPETINSL